MDWWLGGGGCLKDRFPNIYAIAQNKNILVEDVWNGVGEWSVMVNRYLNDWEVKEHENLLFLLSKISSSTDKDKLVWKHKENGEFSVKSYYGHIMGQGDGGQTRLPAKLIWRTQAPPRLAFFAWEARRNSILTVDNLMRRDMVMVNRCFLCKKELETCCHLLLHCSTVQELWHMIFGLIGISWVVAGSVREEVGAWSGLGLRKKKLTRLIPFTIFWIIWKINNM